MGHTAFLDRAAMVRTARRLEYFTILWNLAEGLVGVVAGALAASISLLGFGIDSFLEVTSGAALLWRMSVDADPRKRVQNERLALRVVGACFIALAVYVAWKSMGDLVHKSSPERSIPGIILACVSLAVMPWLSRAKKKVGRSLNSPAMRADAKQTEFCAWLSAILLAGLLLNAFLGWWWADPLAALLMVPIIGNEGIEGLRGKSCPDCAA